jgi:hypothetical protein
MRWHRLQNYTVAQQTSYGFVHRSGLGAGTEDLYPLKLERAAIIRQPVRVKTTCQ